jgi:glycosyltransferase involved in cell wall biosynthesis
MSTPTIAYFTTEYPKASHTFIRREILGLEAHGFGVLRIALRCGDTIVDPLDRAEQQRTLLLLQQPKAALLRQIVHGVALANRRILAAACAAWRLHRNSERGLLRHVAYVGEALALRSYLKSHGIAHVHVHFGTNSAAVAMLMRILGGPQFSMTVHGPDEFDAAIGFSLGAKMHAAAFTVAISNFCAAQLRRWVPYSEWDKIHVVRCTVDEAWFDAARPVAANAGSLVVVGRLAAEKGQLLLVDAYADAVAAGLRSDLVLIGDGPMRAPLEKRLGELGLQNRVQLTGWLDAGAIRERLLASRGLVLASFAEGLPVVIMEAMALMRPVVSTSVAGVPELVRDGEHGWVVVPGDRAALTKALLSIDSASFDKLRAMGAAAHDQVRAHHAVRTEVEKLAGLFRRYAEPCS